MKFSFINPCIDERYEFLERWKASARATPPLGLLYLATIVRDVGVEVSVLDQAAEELSVESAAKWVAREDPDILGFSTVTGSGKTAAAIAKEVKASNPRIVIVFGGYHATFSPERLLKKYPFIDVVVRGEGERAVVELLEWFQEKRRMKDVLGTTFREKGKVLSTPDRPLNIKLDELPFPDRNLLRLRYHSTVAGANIAPKHFTSFLSSRGCPHQCRFCACQRIARGSWRPRSVENMLDEVLLLATEGYKQIMFVDDSFTIDQKRVIEFCHRIRRENLDIELFFEGRVDSCSYDVLRTAARAGCRIMFFGIESASQKVLDYYDKRITPEQSMHAVSTARKAGIDVVSGSFIVGAPHETKLEIEHTLKFAQELSIDIPQFNILRAFPGTEIWRELQVDGVLDEDQHWETGAVVSEISPDTVPYSEVEQMVHYYFRNFFLRPRYILVQSARLLKSSYRSEVVLSNLGHVGSISKSLNSIF